MGKIPNTAHCDGGDGDGGDGDDGDGDSGDASAKCKSVRKLHTNLPDTPVDLTGAPK